MGLARAIFGIRLRWPLAWREAATRKEFFALPCQGSRKWPPSTRTRCVSTRTCHHACWRAIPWKEVIAFETARQFQAMGGKVEIVILLDSRTKYSAPSTPCGRLAAIAKALGACVRRPR